VFFLIFPFYQKRKKLRYTNANEYRITENNITIEEKNKKECRKIGKNKSAEEKEAKK